MKKTGNTTHFTCTIYCSPFILDMSAQFYKLANIEHIFHYTVFRIDKN